MSASDQSGKELPTIQLAEHLQDLWSEFVTWVIHDTGWTIPTSVNTEEQEEQLLRARRQVFADRQLLYYVASSARSFPLTPGPAKEIYRTMQSKFYDCGGYSYGYSLQIQRPLTPEIPCCPAFVTNAILAAMLFRIPYASDKRPLALRASAEDLQSAGSESQLRLTIQTERPFRKPKLYQPPPENGLPWDSWHHSWTFAFDWAKKYGGSCHPRITDDGVLSVGLDIPIKGG